MGLLSCATFAVVVLVFLVQCFGQTQGVASSSNIQTEQCMLDNNLSSAADTHRQGLERVSICYKSAGLSTYSCCYKSYLYKLAHYLVRLTPADS